MRRSELKRGAPLHRRTRLQPFSAKRAALRQARAEAVRQVIERDQVCQFPRLAAENAHLLNDYDRRELSTAGECSGPLDAHEPGLRSHGADPTDPDQAIAICRRHHDFAHRHPRLASLLGVIHYPLHHVVGPFSQLESERSAS